jgi:isopentenyl phosphate kinase
VLTADGAIVNWDLEPLKAALESRVLPVIFGDIVLDSAVGATVLSTESLMLYLAPRMQPKRILLAGLEAAVWADFPVRKVPLQIITPANFASVAGKIGGSAGPDVTGGMVTKVRHMLDLVKEVPGLSVQVFSGEDPATLRAALVGGGPGTVIASD